MSPELRRARWALALALLLMGCAPFRPPSATPPAADIASAWQAPLPHAGQASELTRWWGQFNDPELSDLIEAAQRVSPSLSSAANRIAQARAARVAAGAAMLPQVQAAGQATRTRSDPSSPVTQSQGLGLQASWELDLFGGAGAARTAAIARLAGAQAGWHEARVSVAAETATSYVALRACEAQLQQARLDSASRAETERLTSLSAKAGFQAPANAALARASAAQGRNLLVRQQAQCDSLVKSLVAITGWPEPELRQRLANATARVPDASPIGVATVPASLLQQRPDLYNAAQAVLAAAAEQTQATAARYPQIKLLGNVGALRVNAAGNTVSGSTWSLGPLEISLPVFDGGRLAANQMAAQAAYDDAVLQYQAKVREAVREVEDAFVALQSTASREQDARTASAGFDDSLRAAQARFRGGLASLFELEDARRSALAAQNAVIELQRERTTAWINLYRALGGGWSNDGA